MYFTYFQWIKSNWKVDLKVVPLTIPSKPPLIKQIYGMQLTALVAYAFGNCCYDSTNSSQGACETDPP